MAYRSNSRFHSVWRKARPPASFPGDGPNGAHVFAIWRANPAFENNRSTSDHKSIKGDFPSEGGVSRIWLAVPFTVSALRGIESARESA